LFSSLVTCDIFRWRAFILVGRRASLCHVSLVSHTSNPRHVPRAPCNSKASPIFVKPVMCRRNQPPANRKQIHHEGYSVPGTAKGIIERHQCLQGGTHLPLIATISLNLVLQTRRASAKEGSLLSSCTTSS
jgi:hypothetical protein